MIFAIEKVVGADIELRADPGFVIISIAIAVLIAFLVVKGATSIKTAVGEVRLGVESVEKQVNHVEDPDNEPTVREMLAMQGRMLERLTDRVASLGKEVKGARVAQEDQQGQLAGLGVLVAGQAGILKAHIDAHNEQTDLDAKARRGEVERRHPATPEP